MKFTKTDLIDTLLVVAGLAIFFFVTFRLFETPQKHQDDFYKWKRCMNSSTSTAECMKCKTNFNKEGKFYVTAKGTNLKANCKFLLKNKINSIAMPIYFDKDNIILEYKSK